MSKDPGERQSTGAVAVRLLAHPLFLLLVGGLISALVALLITQRWQDHQRELDVQTALVSGMTTAATSYEQSLGYAWSRLNQGADRLRWIRTLDAQHRQWEVKYAEIRARLLAYYGDSSVVTAWGNVEKGLLLLYYSAPGGSSPIPRHEISALFGQGIDLRTEDGWSAAAAEVGYLRDEAIRRVLDTTPHV